jgi:hypothetical protein
MKMSKFEIVRTDLNNKIVCRAMEYPDAEKASGEYASALMLAGILPMNDEAIVHVSDESYRLSNGWMIQVRAAK